MTLQESILYAKWKAHCPNIVIDTEFVEKVIIPSMNLYHTMCGNIQEHYIEPRIRPTKEESDQMVKDYMKSSHTGVFINYADLPGTSKGVKQMILEQEDFPVFQYTDMTVGKIEDVIKKLSSEPNASDTDDNV